MFFPRLCLVGVPRAVGSWLLVSFWLLSPQISRADDWVSSLYSENGVELRADERIFTLFAALNALGFDQAPIARTDPIPKREFDPVRQETRDAVRISPKLREKFEAFFDRHPQPIRTFTAFTLAVGPAPKFALEKPLPKETEGLKGFEGLLAEFYAEAKIQALFTKVATSHREALKKYAPVIDAPLAQARELLKVQATDDSPRLVLIINLLDGRGFGYGVGFPDVTYLVVGPSGGTPDVIQVIAAFARATIQDPAARKAASLKGGAELLAEIKESGHTVYAESVADYLAETLARAVAIKVIAGESNTRKAIELEYKRGFVLIKEMTRGLGLFAKASKPFDVFLGDFLREIDAGKAAAALKGN